MNDATSGTLILLCALYFLPTIIALVRGHLSWLSITLLNLFLGWTILGWLVALVWSGSGLTRLNREIAVYGRPKRSQARTAAAIGDFLFERKRPTDARPEGSARDR